MISISIDLANSTKIKKKIHDFYEGDSEKINQEYENFAKLLYNLEFDLYDNLLLSEDPLSPPLNFDNIFVMKTIGDEIWLVYELGDIDINTVEFNSVVEKFLTSFSNMHYITKYQII